MSIYLLQIEYPFNLECTKPFVFLSPIFEVLFFSERRYDSSNTNKIRGLCDIK